MTNTNTRELVYLAGLLHDERIWQQISNSEVWTRLGLTLNADKLDFALSDSDSRFVKTADTMACGFDRLEEKHGQSAVPLTSLLSQVRVGDKDIPDIIEPLSFNACPLSLNPDTVMPKLIKNLSQANLDEQTQKLWAGFKAEFDQLPTGNLIAFSGSLHHLLRRFLWCVPAAVQADRTSISLFHHLKLTGALAQCLYDYDKSDEPEKAPLPLQLLCVDLSGIQAFIYNIGSKNAAKSLKGRSFSLQLLLDGIARRLIRKTRTTASHLVYSSGGKFFMLLPNTKKINDLLGMARTEIERAVWDEFGGNLYVCFGQVAFAHDQETNSIQMDGESKPVSLGQLWKAVADKAAEQKQQKNRNILLALNQFKILFEPNGVGGQTELCTVTGVEVAADQRKLKNGSIVSQMVMRQINIGHQLAKHSYQLTDTTGDFRLMKGNARFSLIPTLPDVMSAGSELLATLQPDTDGAFLAGSTSESQSTFGFRFFGGSRMARINGKTGPAKNFEELAGIVRQDRTQDDSPIDREKSTGKYHRLGILRMDVDGLGKLFTHGFKPEKASFSAYATLSGLLDWFFSGYLNTIRERDEFRDWVNIIYSGGDDVFAVGRWDRIVRFADAVQIDFQQFTGRDDLTISAGIELVRPKFPIAKAAGLAGEAEDKAKDFNKAKAGRKPMADRIEKNAVCLFDITVGWDEFVAVQIMKRYWDDWLTEGTLSKGILMSMFDWYGVSKELDKQTGQPTNNQSWRWQAAYNLARHRNNDPHSNRNKALDILKNVLFTGRFTDADNQVYHLRFDAFIMACRWAELTFKDQLTEQKYANV